MFGIAVYINGQQFAAVSRSKRKLLAWEKQFERTGDVVYHARLRDETGWYDGTDGADAFIPFFPKVAEILW